VPEVVVTHCLALTCAVIKAERADIAEGLVREVRRYLAAHGLDPHDLVDALDADLVEAMAAALRRHDVDGATYALH
jgi:hypothetical protein